MPAKSKMEEALRNKYQKVAQEDDAKKHPEKTSGGRNMSNVTAILHILLNYFPRRFYTVLIFTSPETVFILRYSCVSFLPKFSSAVKCEITKHRKTQTCRYELGTKLAAVSSKITV